MCQKTTVSIFIYYIYILILLIPIVSHTVLIIHGWLCEILSVVNVTVVVDLYQMIWTLD